MVTSTCCDKLLLFSLLKLRYDTQSPLVTYYQETFETFRIWWASDQFTANRSLVLRPWTKTSLGMRWIHVLNWTCDKAANGASALLKGLLFLGSFIRSLCLLLVLSIGLKIYHSNWHKMNLCTIKIHKWKFVELLLIRRDFGFDLPLCMTYHLKTWEGYIIFI